MIRSGHTPIKAIFLALACSISPAQTTSENQDPLSRAASLHVENRDTRYVVELLNKNMPEIAFHLEYDERDNSEQAFSLDEAPLPQILDAVCDKFRLRWKYDSKNQAVNLYPKDTGRYEYYPFGLPVPELKFKQKATYEIVGLLGSTPLLKDRYKMFFAYHVNPATQPRFDGDLTDMPLREALNWVCKKDGRRDFWVVYINNTGWASLGFGSRGVVREPKKPIGK